MVAVVVVVVVIVVVVSYNRHFTMLLLAEYDVILLS